MGTVIFRCVETFIILEENITIGGQVGIIDHLHIGKNSIIAAKSAVFESINPNSFVLTSSMYILPLGRSEPSKSEEKLSRKQRNSRQKPNFNQNC